MRPQSAETFRNSGPIPGIDDVRRWLTTDVISSLIPTAVTRQAFAALNGVVRPLLATGLGNPPAVGLGIAVVETTGRVSGTPRQVPLVAFRALDRVYVSTVRGDSQWLANLEANDDARVQLATEFRRGVAAVKRGPLNVAVVELDPS